MKRIWIYQSNRFLEVEEVYKAEQILQEFVEQWTAHGNQLAGSFEVRHKLFIFLMVDEEKAMVTGCSIDKSVHLLKEIEQALGITLFDRLQLAYRASGRSDSIQLASQEAFRNLLETGALDPEKLIVFNNTLTAAEDVDSKWEVPIQDSWHARVFL